MRLTVDGITPAVKDAACCFPRHTSVFLPLTGLAAYVYRLPLGQQQVFSDTHDQHRCDSRLATRLIVASWAQSRLNDTSAHRKKLGDD
jgi:hypothetical protein